MHVIDNPNVYNRLFPESYGYPPFTENEPVTIREADEQRYTRIKVGQEIRIRPTDKPKWIIELREQP
jgi:hypothetical protein